MELPQLDAEEPAAAVGTVGPRIGLEAHPWIDVLVVGPNRPDPLESEE
jgi:hypothetical protein